MSSLSPETAAAMAEAQLVPGQSPSPLRLPDPARLFGQRALRLRELAKDHGLAAWLEFVAGLADAQHKLSQNPPALVDNPDQRWPADLAALLVAYKQVATVTNSAVAEAIGILERSDGEALQALARRLDADQALAGDLPLAPFVVAAQQVAWTRYAASLKATDIQVGAKAQQCPVCSHPPVTGVIHVGSDSGLRYLHCGHCHTAWHHVRASCVACGEGSELSYRYIEDQSGAARAETCDHCKSYTKLLLAEKAPGLDPVADDLASLAVDLLVGDEGYQRVGINPFLIQGA